MNKKFTNWPAYSAEEANKVRSVLLSNRVNYWTGSECSKFEKEFAEFSNSKFAIALSNGTLALELALRALGVGQYDEVIVTSRTFIASVSSIVNIGAIPVFADVDVNSQNITEATIKKVLTKRSKAIICVHLAGWPCDMLPILNLANEYSLFVVEDCAQAHGAKYKGKSVGSFGDVGCWSFCQDKIITTGGEGGMVTTNNKELWNNMWSYKDHGKNWKAVQKENKKDGFKWLHHSFGSNYRMTEMQAAIGRLQLKKMPRWHLRRNKNLYRIWEAASKTNCFIVPNFSCGDCDGNCQADVGWVHAGYKCYVFVNGSTKKRRSIMNYIKSKGVPCFEGSCSEVYLEKAFDKTNYRPKKRLPIAKKLGDISIMFLVHPTLNDSDMDYICGVIENADSHASE